MNCFEFGLNENKLLMAFLRFVLLPCTAAAPNGPARFLLPSPVLLFLLKPLD